jgi:hypothetical protein
MKEISIDIMEEKLWYSIVEVQNYLNIDENRLSRKMIHLNLESRTLPGRKGQFISKRDLLLLEQEIKNPGSVL